MKFKHLIIKFIFLFIYPSILIAAESKIVFIDMDFLMNNSKVGKYINKEIENKQKLKLLDWDFRLTPNSVEAAIYVAWENEIMSHAFDKFVPDKAKSIFTSLQLKTVIDWIESPGNMFLNAKQRDLFVKKTFTSAIADLKKRLGEDTKNWMYGQKNNKHSYMVHALG